MASYWRRQSAAQPQTPRFAELLKRMYRLWLLCWPCLQCFLCWLRLSARAVVPLHEGFKANRHGLQNMCRRSKLAVLAQLFQSAVSSSLRDSCHVVGARIPSSATHVV